MNVAIPNLLKLAVFLGAVASVPAAAQAPMLGVAAQHGGGGWAAVVTNNYSAPATSFVVQASYVRGGVDRKATHWEDAIPGLASLPQAIAPGTARAVRMAPPDSTSVSYVVLAVVYADGATAGDQAYIGHILIDWRGPRSAAPSTRLRSADRGPREPRPAGAAPLPFPGAVRPLEFRGLFAPMLPTVQASRPPRKVRQQELTDLEQAMPMLEQDANNPRATRATVAAEFAPRAQQGQAALTDHILPAADRVCQTVLINMQHPSDPTLPLPVAIGGIARIFQRWEAQLEASKPGLAR